MKVIQGFIFTIIFVFFTGCAQKEQQVQKVQQVQTTQEMKASEVEVVVKQKKKPLKTYMVLNTKPSYETLAIVFPSSDIDRYALEATNTLNAYLMQKDQPFALESFDMMVQNKKNIIGIFDKVRAKKIKKVILLITKDYVNMLQYIPDLYNFEIVLPLINKYDQKLNNKLLAPNILFGAISYKQQFDKLISYAKDHQLVEFYDNSSIGDTLHKYVKFKNLKYSRMIDDNNGRYKMTLKYHQSKIDNSAVILNTPIVKSSMLLSAATAEELEIPLVLSTQLNFTPLLFSLTQADDRKNLVIASSIGKLPADLREYNTLLGNNILYNWVNYSSIVAAEYLLNKSVENFSELSIENNQVIYPVKLYDVKYYSFKEIIESL